MGLHSHIQLRICHSWLVRIDHFPPLFELWKLFSIKLLDHSLPTFVEFHSMNVWLNILAETQEDPYAGSRSSSSEWPAPSAWCDSSPPSREVGLWMAISVFSPRKSYSLRGVSFTALQPGKIVGHTIGLLSFIHFSQGLQSYAAKLKKFFFYHFRLFTAEKLNLVSISPSQFYI